MTTLVELLRNYELSTDYVEAASVDAPNIIERQAAQIEMMREFIARAPVSSGVCCCGEAIDGHSSPMICGHSPVDLWDYSVEQILSTTPDQALEHFAAKVREQCQMTCLEKHANGNWKYDTREECAEAISSIKELP